MKYSDAYQKTKNKIILQEYEPGYIFTAKELSTSEDIDVYEAADILYGLSAELFLEHTSPLEFSVREISVDEINETFEVRKALESLAAKLAILHMDEKSEKELSHLLDDFSKITDEFTYADVDDAIHRKIREIAGNKSLKKQLLAIEEKEHCWWYYLNKNGRIENPVRLALNDHSMERLVKSVVNRDMINSGIAINEHLDYWYRVYNNA